jgi:hypothetical protein
LSALLTVDDDINAATVSFGEIAAGSEAYVYPIEAAGRVIATVAFTSEGRLASIELLDAKRQIPA